MPSAIQFISIWHVLHLESVITLVGYLTFADVINLKVQGIQLAAGVAEFNGWSKQVIRASQYVDLFLG